MTSLQLAVFNLIKQEVWSKGVHMGRPAGQKGSKMSVYIKTDIFEQIHWASKQLDRSVSWIITACLEKGMTPIGLVQAQGKLP